MDNNEILLTPAALLDFLRQVDELADKDISVDETGSTLTVTIGESTYGIDLNQAETVEVPDEVVDEVADVADEAYAELGEAGVDVTDIDEDVVEGSSRSGYGFKGASFYHKIPNDLCLRVKNSDDATNKEKQRIILDFCNFVLENSDNKEMCDQAEELSDKIYQIKPEDKNYSSIIADADYDFAEFLDYWKFSDYIWSGDLGDSSDVVEGGLISEALKTLAVGGLVRLAGKIMGKDVADTLKK